MTKLKIIGGRELSGKLPVGGAKNAALKIISAAILGSSPSEIRNVPKILDIQRMEAILKSIGCGIEIIGNTVKIDPTTINSFSPDPKLMKKLRGSIVLIGPLLARFGEADFSQPGGCLIGSRPIDDHLDVFSQFGIKIEREDRHYHLSGKPKAGHIVLSKMSVTATENALMIAALTPGETTIEVAAAEPEIADLAIFLNKMGAKIKGAGTHEIKISGVSQLYGAKHQVLPDRIEAGTFLIMALSTNSELLIGPIIPNHLSIVLKKLHEAGGNFELINKENQIYIKTKKHDGLRAVSIDTRTYPGFPTDLQSPYAVLMTQAKGTSQIFETLFEGRFLYLTELSKMGTKYEVLSPHIIQIHGPSKLKGCEIACGDIRGGVALVLAGLLAEGETILDQVEFVDRGYEELDKKLQAIGANVTRIEG